MKKIIRTSVVLGLLFYAAIACAQTKTVPSEKINMKQFSLLVRVPLTYSSDQAKSVNPQWDKLLEEWKTKGVYVISFAFPGESYTVSGAEKVVKKEVVLSGDLKVVSNIVLQAETMEAVLEWAKQCPVLPYGGKIEVREIPKAILVD